MKLEIQPQTDEVKRIEEQIRSRDYKGAVQHCIEVEKVCRENDEQLRGRLIRLEGMCAELKGKQTTPEPSTSLRPAILATMDELYDRTFELYMENIANREYTRQFSIQARQMLGGE